MDQKSPIKTGKVTVSWHLPPAERLAEGGCANKEKVHMKLP